MRPARHPLGRKTGLESTAGLTHDAAEADGFSPFNAAPMEFRHGRGYVSEWVPDVAERDALKAGARIRVIQLGKTQIPLRVGVATSLPEDTATTTSTARIEAVARHLVEDFDGESWEKVDAGRRKDAIAVAREVVRIVFGVFA